MLSVRVSTAVWRSVVPFDGLLLLLCGEEDTEETI